MKLNKKLLSTVAIGVLGLITFTPAANAAESKANIEFLPPTAAPKILNPDSPNEDADLPKLEEKEEGTPTAEIGVLTLDFVSNLKFEAQPLNSIIGEYTANSINITTPFAQVTDLRGTGAGWRLVAELGQFTNEAGATSLAGAEIDLNKGEAVTNTNTGNISSVPDVEQEITLTSGDVKEITTATPTEDEVKKPGMGTWITRWQDNEDNTENGNGNVVLRVPGKAATQGNHSATITWTLYNTPTGSDVEELNNEAMGNEGQGQ